MYICIRRNRYLNRSGIHANECVCVYIYEYYKCFVCTLFLGYAVFTRPFKVWAFVLGRGGDLQSWYIDFRGSRASRVRDRFRRVSAATVVIA